MIYLDSNYKLMMVLGEAAVTELDIIVRWRKFEGARGQGQVSFAEPPQVAVQRTNDTTPVELLTFRSGSDRAMVFPVICNRDTITHTIDLYIETAGGVKYYFCDRDACSIPAGQSLVFLEDGSFDILPSAKDHGLLDGLTDDDHTQYALLAGRSGGQTLNGSTVAGEDLILKGTAHATPGRVKIHRLQIQDASADPSATGDLWRNGNNIKWYDIGIRRLPPFKDEEPSTDAVLATWDNTNKYWKQGAAAPIGENLVVNGDMRVDQANEGSAVTVNTSNAFFSVDKWMGVGQSLNTPGVFTLQRASATPPDYFTHYLRATVITADAAIDSGAYYYVYHIIEGMKCQRLGFGAAGAKSITISFRVRSSVSGTFGGFIANSANNRWYGFSYTISATNTWETKTVTIVGDSTGTWLKDTGIGLRLVLSLGGGSSEQSAAGAWGATVYRGGITSQTNLISTLNATFDLTGVKIEQGSIATEFEYDTDYGDVLRDCQREYCKSFAQGVAPATALGVGGNSLHMVQTMAASASGSMNGAAKFPVEMRATPGTITFYNPSAANAFIRNVITGTDFSATSAGSSSAIGFYPNGTAPAGSAAGQWCAVNWVADARLS